MESDIYPQFLEYADVVEFLGLIEIVRSAVDNGKGNVAHVLQQDVPDVWRVSLQLIVSHVAAGRMTWVGVTQKLKQMRRLGLGVAVPFSRSDILRIGAWVKANLGRDVVMDIDYNPSLIGGCVVEFGGRRTDISLRRRLGEWHTSLQLGGDSR